MMKDNVNSLKVKGTVLYTVVSVLMVLIVFLMGTLALAATASNRAYTNYQKEQTEYTARALLDSVVTALNNDTTDNGLKAKLAGLSNEGDIVEIEVFRSDNGAVDADGNPIPEIVTATKLKSQYYYVDEIDATTGDPVGWRECNVYTLSVTNSKSLAETSYSVTIMDAHVVIPDAGAGGAFVSMGGGSVADGGIITGGTSVGLNAVSDTANNYNIQNTFTIEADAYFRGNLTLANKGTFRFVGTNDHVAVTGDLGYGNDIMWEFSSTFEWEDDIQLSYKNIPCVYVGGKFYNTQSVPWDTRNQKSQGGQPVNLYCGYFHLDKPSNFLMTGDIYAFDKNQTSVLKTVNHSELYEWASKNISFVNSKTDADYGFGSLYSAGNVTLAVDSGAMTVSNDLRVAKNLNVEKDVTVNNDVVCGGTLTINSGAVLRVAGDLYVNTLENYGTIDCTGNIYVINVGSAGNSNQPITPYDTTGIPATLVSTWHENFSMSVNTNHPYSYTYSYTEYTREGTNVTSREVSNTVTPEKEGAYNGYWYNDNGGLYTSIVDCWAAQDAKYQQITQMAGSQGEENAVQKSIYDIGVIYGESVYPEGFDKPTILKDIIDPNGLYLPSKYADYPQTLDDFKDKYGMTGSEPIYTSCADVKAQTGTGIITTSCTIKGGWGASDDNIYIKAAGKKLAIVLDGLSLDNYKSIVVDESNGGEVNFYINDNTSLNLSSSGSFLTTEIIRQFYGPTQFDNTIDTDPVSESDTDTFFLTGNFANHFGFVSMQEDWHVKKYKDPLYPDIYVFSGTGASMTCPNASALSINVRAPLLTFTYNSSGQQLGKNLYYDDSGDVRTYPSNEYIAMIGQLIAGDIAVNNYFGLIFVQKEDNTGGGGGGSGLPDSYATVYYNYY